MQVPSCPPAFALRATARQAISRRLASAGTADPGDLKSPSLPGASPGSPTNLRSSSYGLASRRVVNREEQTGSTQDRTALGVQVSPRRPFWNVNRTSGPGLFAKQRAPGNGSVAQVHGIPPLFARVAQSRAGGLIPRIALDQCRVPERYRTRAPFRRPCSVAQPTRLPFMQEITGAKPVRDANFGRVKPFPKTATRPSQSSQRSGGFHTPVVPRAALGTATIFASMQQPADFFCKEISPGRHRLEAPFLCSRSPTAETRR